GVLGGDGVGIGVALEALAPYSVETVAVQTGDEVRAGSSGDAVRRIEVVALAKEAAMVGRVPVLAGVDARPGEVEQAIDVGHDLEAAGDGEFGGMEGGETLLGIDHQQASRTRSDWFHGHPRLAATR